MSQQIENVSQHLLLLTSGLILCAIKIPGFVLYYYQMCDVITLLNCLSTRK